MWIVRLALRRPYTFIVMALLIMIFGVASALRTPTDIFPDIRIPVIGVVWQYTGLPPDEMAGRIVTPFQRALTTTVNDIEHIAANSYNGVGIVKIFFQPNVDIRTANAQVTAISQTLIKQMPPGATPPLILNYSASTVPIIQVALSGEGLTEQNLADIGINQLRTPLVTVPGAAIPYPFGGKQRQVQIDLNPQALQARGLSGQDVANALRALQSDADTLNATVIAEQTAAASLNLSQQQYQLGAINYLVLLVAQQAYETAQAARIRAQGVRYADTAALFQALGGGWWNRADVDPSSKGKPGVFTLPPVQDIKLPRAGH